MLLDEPTTHLDVNGREALESALKSYKGALCVVSHDVTFTRNIAEHIIAIDPSGVSRFPGGYDYYLEKTEQRAAVSQPAAAATPDANAPAAGKGKDARKARAQQRDAEKALKKIELKIEKLTEEQAALTDEMMSKRDADFASLNARLAKIQTAITALELEWEDAAATLS